VTAGNSISPRTTLYSNGTEGYRAPELLELDKCTFTNKVDIWAMGCLFYELIYCRKTFSTDWATHQYARRTPPVPLTLEFDMGRPGVIFKSKLSRKFVTEIVLDMLQIDPVARPAARDILQKLVTVNYLELITAD